MTVEQALKRIPSLKDAAVAAGKDGLDAEISGVMVLEASDIENWGRRGLLLLSSFFAFREMGPETLGSFLIQCRQIGISGILLKTGRLIADVPTYFIDSCNNLSIPLITLPADTQYENIVISILEPIISKASRESDRRQRSADLLGELLSGQLRTASEAESALDYLGLAKASLFQVLLAETVSRTGALTAMDEGRASAAALTALENHLSLEYPELSYAVTSRGAAFLIGLRERGSELDPGHILKMLEKELQRLERYHTALHITLSTVGGRDRIHELNREALDTRMIMNMTSHGSYASDYNSLGIYKLFTDEALLSRLPGLITPSHAALRTRKPELWKTLETFLSVSESCKETAAALYLHPKTVKYRLDLIRNEYGIDYTDTEELFRILLDIRLFRILDNLPGGTLQ